MGLNEKVTKVTSCKLLSKRGLEVLNFLKMASGEQGSYREGEEIKEKPRSRGGARAFSHVVQGFLEHRWKDRCCPHKCGSEHSAHPLLSLTTDASGSISLGYWDIFTGISSDVTLVWLSPAVLHTVGTHNSRRQ